LILVVSQYFRPEPNISISDIAETLADSGEEVVVLTSHPNHPQGRFYPEVTTLMPTRQVKGKLTIWRLPVYPCRSKSKFGRFASYLSFCFSSFLCSLFVARSCTVAYVYQTPFTSALSVLWLKLAQGTRLAYVVVDLWPESFSAAGVAPPGPLMKVMHWYSRAINRFADHIFASTQGTRDRYLKDGIPAEKVSFTPIWVEGIPANYREPLNRAESSSFTIVYAGNLGPSQRLETLLYAAKQLEQDPGISFHFYGNGNSEESLKALRDQLGLHNVHFLGLIPPAEAFQKSREADATVLHLANTLDFQHTIPSKLVSMLAAGPTILCGVPGETSRLVETHGAGILFEPENPEDLVRAIRLAQGMTTATRMAMRECAWSFYDQVFEKKRILAEHLAVTHSLKGRAHSY